MDCKNKGRLFAENIWEGLKILKRPNKDESNIYNCLIGKQFLHTTSVNDFVLKSGVTHKGSLNKVEFASGILVGYANRQINNIKVYKDSTLNGKIQRWSQPGNKEDLFCSALNEIGDLKSLSNEEIKKKFKAFSEEEVS